MKQRINYLKKQPLSSQKRRMTSLSFLSLLTILAVFLLLTETLTAQELPRRVQIGMAMQPVENGVQVTFAPEHQPAAMAGIREGDIIRSMDGEPIHAIIAMSTFGVPWFEYLIANSRRQLHLSGLSLSEIENRMSETVKAHYMYTIEKKSPERSIMNWYLLS